MRNLILILIAFLAIVTLIRVLEKPEIEALPQHTEIDVSIKN